jgi:O-antigen ligase
VVLAAAGVASLVVVMSLSRSSMVCLTVFYAVLLLRSRLRLHHKLLLVASVGGALFYLVSHFTGAESALMARANRTFASEDATSGRLSIWRMTLPLIARHPWFGYGFEPFSHFSSTFDTPHNQYLELLYKGGLTVLVTFLGPVFFACRRALASREAVEPIFGALLLGVLVSNITQPNLTYAPTASFLFFWWGALWWQARQARHSAHTLEPRAYSDPTPSPAPVA